VAPAPRATATRTVVTVTPERTRSRVAHAPRNAGATTAVHASTRRPERLTAKRLRHAPAATRPPVVSTAVGRPARRDAARQAPRYLYRGPAGGATPSARTAVAVAHRTAGASRRATPHPAASAASGSVHWPPWIADEQPSFVPVRS